MVQAGLQNKLLFQTKRHLVQLKPSKNETMYLNGTPIVLCYTSQLINY